MSLFASLIAATVLAPDAVSQTPPAAPAKQEQKEDEFAKAVKDFTKKEGVLNAYVKDENLFFEVPTAELSKDFLWYAELKGAPADAGSYSGQDINQAVFRFEKRGDKVLVRWVSHANRASDGTVKFAVEKTNTMPIVASLPIKGTSPTGGLLVDVARLFRGGIPEMSLAGGVGANLDTSRTFIDKVTAFPMNVNVEVLATAASPGRSVTAVVHHSFIKLPENPMMGRLQDSRVGYFSNGFTQYDASTNGTKAKAYINRYRLEKKDPGALVSEPVKPIVYYIGREVPAKWHPYIKQGIEDWQAAFEEAGFKNAIICKEAPTPEQDPDWSEEDVRYSVIRWAALPIENALGPSVTDPRTGEILSAHVIMWHDVLKLGNDWYFAQASACDPVAQHFPFPDSLTGEILRFIVAHEVGHTLGLPHNMKSSGMIPTEWLRDPKWTAENGTCTSIMDYARFNYVAQPGDGARLMPKVGAYDRFSIKWGYMPLGMASPEDETSSLDAIAAIQSTTPWLRFGDPNFTDPTALMEALGDDAVIASNYSIANLKRTMGYLERSSSPFGEPYDRLAQSHGAITSQFSMYMSHVATMVGGIVVTDYHAGRGDAVYSRVPADRQRAAVQWFLDNVITPPTWLYPSDTMGKLSGDKGQSALMGMPGRGVNTLLNDGRLVRLMDGEKLGNGYGATDLLAQLRQGIWSKYSAKALPTDMRYAMQADRAWVSGLITKLSSSNGEVRSLARSELATSVDQIKWALANGPLGGHPIVVAHLKDLLALIEFSQKFPPAAAPAPAPQIPFFLNGKGCNLWSPIQD